jgi:hypothetical protein
MYDIRFEWVRGEYIRVLINGSFAFTADTINEAYEELRESGYDV